MPASGHSSACPSSARLSPSSSCTWPLCSCAWGAHLVKTPAPALQVAIWAGRPGCWNDSMVWKGGAVALCWHVSLTPQTPCLMGRGHSDSGTLQPGLRVIRVRTAQPLTLASTNKQSASKHTSLGNGTLCYPVQVLSLPAGPQCSISQTAPPTPTTTALHHFPRWRWNEAPTEGR